MLNNIENRLEELFDLVESLPPDKVEAAKKVSYFVYLCVCSYIFIYKHTQYIQQLQNSHFSEYNS